MPILRKWRLQIAALRRHPANPKILRHNEKSILSILLTCIIISYELSYCELGEKSIKKSYLLEMIRSQAPELYCYWLRC